MEQIGRYVAEERLGQGAFGTVWLARDDTIDARVAIKVLADNWAEDPAIRKRFIDEAKILFQAESDHLVRVHAVDELPDGRPYFVMEYADRGSLEERMRQRFDAGQSFSVNEALAISRDIASGLKVAHALGIAHRDLKPANVMFRSMPEHLDTGNDERLVLADFGVAKSLASGGSTTIATGTPHYMAPEQAEGRADHRSDLYSAAVILYELLAGRVPYPVDSIGALLRAQATASFPPLSSIRGDVPAGLEEAIRRNLSPDPDQRFPDVAAWRAALDDPASVPVAVPVAASAGDDPPPADAGATLGPEELARMRASGEIPAAGGGTPPPPPPPAPPGSTQPPEPPAGPPKRNRRPLVVSSVAVIAVLAAVVGSAIALGSGDEADGPAAEVFLEPISSVGRDPFVDVALDPDTIDTDAIRDTAGDAIEVAEGAVDTLVDALKGIDLPALDLPDAPDGPDGGVVAVSGDAPGLYGGTNLLSVCDPEQLVAFLEANVDKAQAWAETIGIEVDDIAGYVGELTDVILQADTRVLNHGFRDGIATPINSVLQAGTAVLIDTFGIPRVRCKCGNPLLPAEPLSADVTVSGTAWPGFELDASVTVSVGAPVDEFVFTDVVTDNPVFRLPGEPASETTTEPQVLEGPRSTSTTAPTTTTTAPPPSAPITSAGSVGASSTFSGEFAASLAVDGSNGTSWFSAGGGSAVYTWTAPQSGFIERVTIVGNGGHSNPDFRTGFGFGSVQVVVLDSGGNEVFRESHSLGGTPDPTVTANVGTEGQTVRLEFSGGEDPSCGGFAELQVVGRL